MASAGGQGPDQTLGSGPQERTPDYPLPRPDGRAAAPSNFDLSARVNRSGGSPQPEEADAQPARYGHRQREPGRPG
jgi:hypothetical protein